jgi:hypothetical protein
MDLYINGIFKIQGSIVTVCDTLSPQSRLFTLKHKFPIDHLFKEHTMELKQGIIITASLTTSMDLQTKQLKNTDILAPLINNLCY